MDKKLVILIAAAMMVFPYSCKKKLPNHGVNADLEKGFSFKAGSYWVYKDSLNGKEDSFCLKLYRRDVGTNATGEFTYDLITTIIQPANLLNYVDSNTIEYQISEHNLFIRFILHGDVSHLYGGYDYDAVQFPFTNTTVLNQSVTLLDNVSINGNLFQDVAKVCYKTAGGDLLYFKGGIGIVKIDIKDVDSFGCRHVWELERWHVVH